MRTLGFYTGSTDGNATSTAMKTAIKNFQRVYGLSQNQTLDSATTTKLNTVYNSYYSCYNSSDTSEVVNKLGLDNTQKKNFALTWTFLRTGMGLTIEQAAGVMGNIFAESGFSASNAEDIKGYPGMYNSNYTYSTTDEVGYGLMQWTNSTRKACMY
ncbi:MAG: phage tail tip lysozyme [Butyrivibrio sp.]